MKGDSSKSGWWARVFVDGIWTSAAVAGVVALLTGRPRVQQPLNHPDVRFEESDINARYVLTAGIAVLLLMYLGGGVIYFLFHYFAQQHIAQSPPPLRISAQSLHSVYLPPEPRLQQDPHRELQEYMAAQNAKLNSYGWVDKGAGVVSIPIDQAMNLIVQRGIPPQNAPPNQFYRPQAGTLETGLAGKVEPEPR
jgi:hypothetical protein